MKKDKDRRVLSGHPNPDCKICHGMGEVAGDWVPYGSTSVRLPDSLCECVDFRDQQEQFDNDQYDDYELILHPRILQVLAEEDKEWRRIEVEDYRNRKMRGMFEEEDE